MHHLEWRKRYHVFYLSSKPKISSDIQVNPTVSGPYLSTPLTNWNRDPPTACFSFQCKKTESNIIQTEPSTPNPYKDTDLGCPSLSFLRCTRGDHLKSTSQTTTGQIRTLATSVPDWIGFCPEHRVGDPFKPKLGLQAPPTHTFCRLIALTALAKARRIEREEPQVPKLVTVRLSSSPTKSLKLEGDFKEAKAKDTTHSWWRWFKSRALAPGPN